jgi:hypothetical protein
MTHLLDFKNKEKSSSGLIYLSIKKVVEYATSNETFLFIFVTAASGA